jgi:hypothetical protein
MFVGARLEDHAAIPPSAGTRGSGIGSTTVEFSGAARVCSVPQTERLRHRPHVTDRTATAERGRLNGIEEEVNLAGEPLN